MKNTLTDPALFPAEADRLNASAWELRNKQPTDALQLAQEAFRLSDAANYKKGKADSLQLFGFMHMHAAQHEKAYTDLFEALQLYSEAGDETGIANAQYTLGVVHMRTGNFEAAIEMLHKSLAYREQQNDRHGVAACYFQLSYVHHHFNDYDAAEEAVTRSLTLRRAINDLEGIGGSLMLLGEVYLRAKRLTEARQALEESLLIRQQTGEKLGYFATMLRYTELYLEEGKPQEALSYSEKGLAIAQESNINFGVIRFLQMQARILYAMGDHAAAKQKNAEALAYAEKYSFRSIAYELHELMAKLCSEAGDYKSAYEHLAKFIRVKEEIVNFQSNARLKSVQLMNQIESAKREAELERDKNEQLTEAYGIIEERNKDITDSIRYARRIQHGILPSPEELQEALGEHFILFLPRDIVSGDFYWATTVTTTPANGAGKKMKVLAAVDCTGHGVPGAFMSILGNMLINQTVRNPEVNSPADALNFLNRELPKNLKAQNRDEVIRDGMDIAMIAIDEEALLLHYATANNPVYLVRNGELTELKGDKQAISGSTDIPKFPFTNHTVTLREGDCIYLFTDGYADQFGGPKGKKFKYKQLQEKLCAVHSLTMSAQREQLEKNFREWKGDLEQVDDVLVIGIRIG